LFDVTTASNATSAYSEHIHQDLTDDSFFERHAGKYDWVIFDLSSIDFLITNTQKSVYDLFMLLVAKGGTLIVTPEFGPRSYCLEYSAKDKAFVHTLGSNGTPTKDHFNSCREETPHLLTSDFICSSPVCRMKWEIAKDEFVGTFRGENPTRFVPVPLPKEFQSSIRGCVGMDIKLITSWYAQWLFTQENPEPRKKYNMREVALENLKEVFSRSFDKVELLTGEYSGFEGVQYFKCSGRK